MLRGEWNNPIIDGADHWIDGLFGNRLFLLELLVRLISMPFVFFAGWVYSLFRNK